MIFHKRITSLKCLQEKDSASLPQKKLKMFKLKMLKLLTIYIEIIIILQTDVDIFPKIIIKNYVNILAFQKSLVQFKLEF